MAGPSTTAEELDSSHKGGLMRSAIPKCLGYK